MQQTTVKNTQSKALANAVIFSKRRAGLQLVGAFSFIAVVAVLLAAAEPSSNQAKASAEPSGNLTLTVSHGETSDATSDAVQPASPINNTSSASDSSTNAATTPTTTTQVTNAGTGSSQVTVNGKSVTVPSGSSYSTTTPSGGSMNISSSTSSTGSSSTYGYSYSHSSVNSDNLSINDTTVESSH